MEVEEAGEIYGNRIEPIGTKKEKIWRRFMERFKGKIEGVR